MFLVLLLACPFCILPVYFWAALLFFVINTCYFIHKKKCHSKGKKALIYFSQRKICLEIRFQ